MVAGAVDFVAYLALDARSRRVVASVREVVDADGPLVVSNEVFRSDGDGRAVPGVPLRAETLDQLAAASFDPEVMDRPGGWWD
jgi:hypothetical protein